MKRIILFSDIENNPNLHELLSSIFPSEIQEKSLAFMPSSWIDPLFQPYYEKWQEFAKQYQSKFQLVNNAVSITQENLLYLEKDKIEQSNILVISGGNPFLLMHNLRQTGLDEVIIKFTQKKSFILAGYSAGAIILTPSLNITTMKVLSSQGTRIPIYKERGKTFPSQLKSLAGLGIVDFEFFPHFEEKYTNDIELYRTASEYPVKTCTDGEFFIIEN
jgi:dipeptidase E